MSDDQVPIEAAVSRSRADREGVRQAGASLDAALSRPGLPFPAQWAARVGEATRHLGVAFERHVRQAEGDDGMLNDITRTAPRLAHAVSQIELEHQQILEAISTLQAQTDALDDSAQVPEIRESGLILLKSIAAHRYRGADLAFEAYSVDIEAAD